MLAPELRSLLGDPTRGPALIETAEAVRQRQLLEGRRGLAICGAASGAGVTFTTAALAAALASLGVRVAIVEANLRRPRMHELIAPPEENPTGILQVLRGDLPLGAAVTFTDLIPNLSVTYAGGVAEDPQELFDADRFERYISDSLRSHDLTLVDTPPANRCAEARRIAGVARYAAVVARRNNTFSEDLTTLVADLRKNRVEVVGAIYNEG